MVDSNSQQMYVLKRESLTFGFLQVGQKKQKNKNKNAIRSPPSFLMQIHLTVYELMVQIVSVLLV